jgi:hypothetical protein
MSANSKENLACLCELNCSVYLHPLKFQKMKEHFQGFLKNTAPNDEVQAATASIQNNNESQDFHKEVMLSVQAENSTDVQGTTNYTLPLRPDQRVSLEQSAEEILRGVKKDVQVEYIIPVREELPSEIGMYILHYITLHKTFQKEL